VDEEVRLLTAAQAAIRAGQPAQGLALLDQHAARFPKGKLSEARDVAHMMAQCALGNRDASRREVERFLRHSPRSPYADRVQRICTSNQ
jgi:regulator of sirC expression with transglutaminase-like and TPR domain